MKLERQLKLALDESRLLMLGSQVLYGFQFNGIFQQQFAALSFASRALLCAGLPFLTFAVALLITPSMVHRIVERGETSRRMLTLATGCAAAALFPVAITLALDMFVAVGRATGEILAAAAAAAFFCLAMLCWYVTAWFSKRKENAVAEKPQRPTPLETQVDQLLTEARVIIPGAQALLGFQLTVTLTQAFAALPQEAKLAHVAALCCMGLSVILLMAPASVHRIAFSGQDDPDFLLIGSVFVIGAPLPLALGIALDAYVAAGRALSSEAAAVVLGFVSLMILVGFWYLFPLWRRVRT